MTEISKCFVTAGKIIDENMIECIDNRDDLFLPKDEVERHYVRKEDIGNCIHNGRRMGLSDRLIIENILSILSGEMDDS